MKTAGALTAAVAVAIFAGACSDTSTTVPPPTNPASSTTTSTFPPLTADVALFALQLEALGRMSSTLALDGSQINQEWDDRSANYQQTHDALESLLIRSRGFAESMTGIDAVWPRKISGVSFAHARQAADRMASYSNEMVSGLEAPDDGSLRRKALGEFRSQGDVFREALAGLLSDIDPGDERRSFGSEVALDPALTRPVYSEFFGLTLFNDGIRTECSERFGFDTAACYDFFERATESFEKVILDGYENQLRSLRTSPGYNANQYGCHSDGRCLDDFDVWCDEEDFSYVSNEYGSAGICNADQYLDQSDYYDDYGYSDY